MRTLKVEFGYNVSSRRKALRLTQEKLAEMCELDRTTIGQIEAGKSNATLETIELIANALDVHPSELLKTETYHRG
ncbi:hypothetical protein CBW65_22535 [Tumebacillus avium]|uniref:HTH cro/C1-type domain-containing protein n=1 Tax=Tumebacillus avium TaxID=1903704 RepID=A0A1Y0IVF3_9BACL|nr:helix-turn-helix transcriptional regulator [Tumebacillus avium]ARU63465.1 hypothetical protein CBW65_22535 [Tumebacillus avium]